MKLLFIIPIPQKAQSDSIRADYLLSDSKAALHIQSVVNWTSCLVSES